MSGWDFTGQDLIQSNFTETVLNNTDFSGADMRGGPILPSSPSTILRNTIRYDSRIRGLELKNTDSLLVRDFDSAIFVTQGFAMADQGTLDLQFADASWGSKITFTPSLIPDLGGVLALSFAPSADLAAMPGTVFDLFDWPAPLSAANRFDRIDTPAGSEWDLSNLYTTGEVRLLAIPEPSSIALTALRALALLVAFRLRHSAAHTPAKRHSTSRNLIAIFFAAATSLLTVSRANAEIHFLHVPSDAAPVYPQRPIVVDGTTLYGWGRDSQAKGLLYRINTDGSGLQVLKYMSFEPPSGFVLNSSTLYAGAGSFSGGHIFKINTDGTGESSIHAFSSLLRPEEGLQPTTTMTLAEGTLYGLAEFGGIDNAGTLFKLNLDGSGFQTLYRFEERSLALNNIMGPTLAVSGSTVFGITHGSSNRSATLYRIDADGSDFQVLHTFTGNRGLGPTPGLHIVDSVLYGAVSAENTPGGYIQGSIYRINTDGTDFQAIRPLNGSASFLQLDGSTFYGIASSAAGVDAFGMNIDGSDYQVLHHFTSGDLPVSFVKSGSTLYGVTSRESEIFAIPIPEPGTWALAAFAFVGLASVLRRTRVPYHA